MNRKLRRENRRRWNPQACAPAAHNAIIQQRKARRRQRRLVEQIRQRLGITLMPFANLIPTKQLHLVLQPGINTPPRSRQGIDGGPVIYDEIPQLPTKRQMVDDLVNSYLPAEDR